METGTEVAVVEQKAVVQREETQVADLLRLAVDKDLDVDKLAQLIELQERVMDRGARAAFFAALTAFREECPPIKKTRENSQFSVMRNGTKVASRYAPLEEIDRVARPIAAKHDLMWTWDTRLEGELMHVTCRVSHVMGHSESTDVAMPYESKAGSSPQQKFGSTQMYGMRYSLIAALGLTAADEDVDGAAGLAETETISAKEAAEIEAECDELGVDKRKLCEWAHVDSIPAITRDRLQGVRGALARKRTQREAADA